MEKQLNLNFDHDTERVNLVNPVFARHETFHPRFGWIKKGFDAVSIDPTVFSQDNAPMRLGVGKNMVISIRYWCHAFKILENDTLTKFGQCLLSDDGWDPFIENPATLWLLHWNLLKPTCHAAAWYFTFNIFRKPEFLQDELFNALYDYKPIMTQRNIAESSLKKDITCILRMYVEQSTSKAGVSEDSLDCPFTQLGLIHTAGDSRHFTFRIGNKSNLPPEIVVVACLQYASNLLGHEETISISRLVYDSGSPGMVFKLSESAMCDAIEQVATRWNAIELSDTAGLIQMSFTSEPANLAEQILENYYNN